MKSAQEIQSVYKRTYIKSPVELEYILIFAALSHIVVPNRKTEVM
jgi:hypothetical protein